MYVLGWGGHQIHLQPSFFDLLSCKEVHMLIPAAKITRFFITYCPSMVNTNGRWENILSGKTKKVRSVPNMCRTSNPSAHLKNLPVIKRIPIRLSKVANTGKQLPCGKIWAVRVQMVEEARSSAGLRPVKNFTIPSHMKIIPILHLNKSEVLNEPKKFIFFIFFVFFLLF